SRPLADGQQQDLRIRRQPIDRPMRVIDRRRRSGKQTNCRRNLGADGRAATATLNLVKTIKPSRSKIVDEAPLLLDGLSPLQQRLVSRPSSRERIGDRGNGYFIHPPRL